MNLNVQVKQAGKKVNKIKTVVMEIKEPPKTVEELLIAAVKQTRELFVQKRKKSEKLEQGDLSQVSLYNEEQIEDMASVGKVVFGFSLNNRVPSEKEAIETALQAFEDGLNWAFVVKELKNVAVLREKRRIVRQIQKDAPAGKRVY